MMEQKIKVLVAKPGLDGHDRGAKIIASGLRDAGMEVIYTGLRQTPEMIVRAALQEDVDVIAVSILSGSHMSLFPRIVEAMKTEGLDDILLIGGGIIPEQDAEELRRIGVAKLFGPGTVTTEVSDFIKQWYQQQRLVSRSDS